jgi:hypothetical protein
MIPEQQDYSMKTQDIERQEMDQSIGQNMSIHRTEHERYSINRRQNTNAVMSNLISLTCLLSQNRIQECLHVLYL